VIGHPHDEATSLRFVLFLCQLPICLVFDLAPIAKFTAGREPLLGPVIDCRCDGRKRWGRVYQRLTYHVRCRVLRRDVQAHVHDIRHQVALHNLVLFVLCQFLKRCISLTPQHPNYLYSCADAEPLHGFLPNARSSLGEFRLTAGPVKHHRCPPAQPGVYLNE
jgi:hypothetical protein